MFGKLQRQKQFTKERLKEKPVQVKEVAVKQYPKKLNDQDPTIFDPYMKTEFITPVFEVENTFYDRDSHEFTKEERAEYHNPGKFSHQKTAKVAVIGPPNSGKSSILNKIMDQKLNAVSKITNTTVEPSYNIRTFPELNAQLVFMDTPGILAYKHKKKEKSNDAWKEVDDSDFVVLVVDCLKQVDEGLGVILRRLQFKKKPAALQALKNSVNDLPVKGVKFEDQPLRVILVLNKVDLCNNQRRLAKIKDEIEDYIHFEKVFITSAETGFGLDELEDYLANNAEFGAWDFSGRQISEKSEVEIIEEFARNAMYTTLYKELPYKIPVELERLAVRADGLVRLTIRAKIHKRSQLPIMVGKKGKKSREMRQLIAKDFMERYGLKCEIYLKFGYKKYIEMGSDAYLYTGNEEKVNKLEMEDMLKNTRRNVEMYKSAISKERRDELERREQERLIKGIREMMEQ